VSRDADDTTTSYTIGPVRSDPEGHQDRSGHERRGHERRPADAQADWRVPARRHRSQIPFRVLVESVSGAAAIPHAFGGALALAWCTERARGTIDIDVNVFLGVDHLDEVVGALPHDLTVTATQRSELAGVGQTRLWWGRVPVDVFLDTTDFHRRAALRVHRQHFAGADIAFLGCSDLAVLKAFSDRTKDWADLEEMVAAGTLDVDRVVGMLARYLGPTDHRVSRLLALDHGPDSAGS